MAKRRVASAQSAFAGVMRSIPSEAKFEVPMVADSTDETWVDIDTNLQAGEAWVIYGAEWRFENIPPTAPLAWATALNCFSLQVHRNDDAELLLGSNDDDLMFEDILMSSHTVTVGGTDTESLTWPRRFGRRTVTLSQVLRVMFRTQVDNTIISAATVQIAGRLFYDRIAAPDIGTSKIGQIANL